jgi:exopolysaccharide biosynthesis WecB/TagA/CpsF family protein
MHTNPAITSAERFSTDQMHHRLAGTDRWRSHAGAPRLRPTRLFGISLVNARLQAIAAELADRAAADVMTTVSFINAHCANVLRRDPAYRAAIRASDMVLPDGSGVRIAARMMGEPMGDNLNGTDLFPELCNHAAERGVSIFLLGGHPGVARACGTAMAARNPGLCIAGSADGYFDAAATDRLIHAINASGAGILLVGMGVPTQEKWIAAHRSRISVPVVLAVGGLFDYYAGRIPRAPLALRRIGCEWVWRLLQEPHRLAGRYVVGNAAFLSHAIGDAAEAPGVSAMMTAAGKRSLDLAVALAMLVVAAPIIAAIALAIKLDDGGPVFFRQVRVGDGGKPFNMLKFRSMAVNAEARRAALLALSERDETCFKMKRDPRITRIGRVLRRLSLDELPQILNVLHGSMSLVGPRPALPEEAITYGVRGWKRLRGKPGITCTWQVSGRAEIPFARQVEMDIAYLRRQSLWHDIALLFRTIPAVLSARGAY